MDAPRFMLLAKGWYCFYWAGLVSITPYFNLYFKQRGLTDGQIGIISAARQWVSVPSSFLWAGLADRLAVSNVLPFNAHQTVLAVVLIASTTSRLALIWAGGFGAFLAVVIANQFVTSPVTVMADAIVMSHVEHDGDYGKARAWGAVGWGGFSAAAGAIINAFGMTAGFITSAAITAPCIIATYVMKYKSRQQQVPGGIKQAPEQQVEDSSSQQDKVAQCTGLDFEADAQADIETGDKGHREKDVDVSCTEAQQDDKDRCASSKSGESTAAISRAHTDAAAEAVAAAAALSFTARLRLLLSRGEVWLFLWQTVLQGLGLGVYQGYLFIALADMGASELLMGLTITVDCLAEFPAFHYQRETLRFLSLDMLIHVSVITYSVRLACYALLPYWRSPWAVLPVQLLHGLTYAWGWGAGTIKSKRLAPPGLQATMQGIFQAAYVGVGQGLGSLLGGLLMARYGSQLMFVQLSLAIAAGWLISLVAGWALKAAGRRQAAGTLAATCSSTISTSGQTD